MRVVLGTDPIRYPMTGIGRYSLELGIALSSHEALSRLSFLSGTEVTEVLPRPTLMQVSASGKPAGRGLTAMLRARFRRSGLAGALHQWIHPLRQARALRRHSGAIYHGTNYYLPPHSGPRVTTFHDLSVFSHPECHPPERVRYMQSSLPGALKLADIVITDAECVRQELAHYFGFPLERIVAVPLGVSADYRVREEAETSALLRRLGLRFRGFALFVGTIEPRKNIDTLLDAYSRLPLPLRQRYPLIVAGFFGWKSEALHIRLHTAEAEGWCHYLGYLDDADLAGLYAAARLFVYPSLYEGFGLPVLEAMASGVPVICSDASALVEVMSGVGCLHGATDVVTLSEMLVRALEDDEWRNEQSARGVVRAAEFSWAATAEATVGAYRRVWR